MEMRLNKFIAQNTEISRRGADTLIADGRVAINGEKITQARAVQDGDIVSIDGKPIHSDTDIVTIVLNKPRGYVCSRNGQGSRTIYDLLPKDLSHLNSVGRLDKDSSGLLVLTNDGALSNQLTHPRYQKTKVYEVSIDKPLLPLHQQMISDYGIQLEDGVSKLHLEKRDTSGQELTITMQEGRNRQIRRTFSALGYEVTALHRTVFGNYTLKSLKLGEFAKSF